MSIKYSFSYHNRYGSILYLVPTPIGNLSDVSLRTIEILKSADIIACEDTRKTADLLKRLGIEGKKLLSCFSQKEQDTAKKLIAELKDFAKVLVFVSDAGSPGISDPGCLLVKEAIENDIPVSAVPGPCAFVPALTASGFDTAHFTFVGFLPVKENAREKELRKYIDREETLIFYEAPHRLLKTLTAMEKCFGSDRRISIGRELTKLYEQYIRGTLKDILDLSEDCVRGEFVIVIEGKTSKENISYADATVKVKELLLSGISLIDATKRVSSEYDLSKNKLYKLIIDEIN